MKFIFYVKSKANFQTENITIKAENKKAAKKLFKKKYGWMLENWRIWKIKAKEESL